MSALMTDGNLGYESGKLRGGKSFGFPLEIFKQNGERMRVKNAMVRGRMYNCTDELKGNR